jgi:hypothetical protein
LYSEAISEAHALVGASPEGVPFEALFEALFASRAETMTVAEAMVLYPQFRALVAPAMLRNMRQHGTIGINEGVWVRVAGNRALEQARHEDRLTGEEEDILARHILADQ